MDESGSKHLCVDENSTWEIDRVPFKMIERALHMFQESKIDRTQLDEIRSGLSERGSDRATLLSSTAESAQSIGGRWAWRSFTFCRDTVRRRGAQ